MNAVTAGIDEPGAQRRRLVQQLRVLRLIAATEYRLKYSESALGYVWSADGREVLYLKSRVVMAARAAGKAPLGGLWQQVHDIEGLRAFLARDRQLGMTGVLLLHPSNVAPANETFSPSAAEIAYYEGMIDALAAAVAAGRASCIYDGEHIDIAHVETALQIIAMAASVEN